MNLERRFQAAIQDNDPVDRLRALAIELIDEGNDREVTLAAFETMRGRLSAAGRDDAEDAVCDVMDFLVGRCSPHSEIRPETGKVGL